MSDSSTRVFLVGAGPGDPGLMTVRARECLAQAEVVLYDKLVPVRLLDYAPAHAERICVADLPGCHLERWPYIHELMIARAKQGKCVVRLKGGDPFLFGRGGEEAEALRQAGLTFEVVPGVTAALAAAGCAGIPLTHRLHASAVALITGHENPAKPESVLDWGALARFPGTLVIYMGMSRLGQLIQALLTNGKAPDTPAAIVQHAGLGNQRTLEAPLGSLAAAANSAGLHAPAIIVIGPVVSLRQEIAWFERRPLFGKRVLVTRPRAQAEELARRLEQLGAIVSLMPVIEIHEPADWEPVDAALATLGQYQWLVFTSANGVHAFVRRLWFLGKDLRALGGCRLAAIGPGTAEVLQSFHLQADLVPPVYRSESLASALKDRVAGQRVLLARADRGRDVLREELSTVAQVDQVAVYSQQDAAQTNPMVLEALRSGGIDYVTLTSSNIVRSLAGHLDAPSWARISGGELQLVSISPVTTAVARELGLRVAAEAKEYTTAGLTEAMIELAGRG